MQGKIKTTAYLLFVISNCLMLINPGVFWDDWTLYNMSDKGIMTQFHGNGAVIFGYMHVLLQKLPNAPIFYHLLTFVLQLISIYTLFKIIDKWFTVESKGLNFAYFAVLIYSVLPLGDAKIAMICLPFTLCLTVFILAIYFLVRFKLEQQPLDRSLSLLLFFFSFMINSFVVFYLIPFIWILYSNEIKYILNSGLKNFAEVFSMLIKNTLRYWDFLLLPFIFWIFKGVFLAPSQQYAALNYNEIGLNSLVAMPTRLIKFSTGFFTTLVPLLQEMFTSIEFIVLFLILVVVILYRLKYIDFNIRVSIKFLLIGVIIIFLGIIPYIIVNKYPFFSGFDTRHQLLIGFGLALLFCNLLFLIKSATVKKVILALSLGLFVSFNVFIQYSYFKGYLKYKVLDDYFVSHNPEKEFPQTIFIIDNTGSFTQKGNVKSFYEYSGILKLHSTKENTMLVWEEDYIKNLNNNKFEHLEPYFYQYNLSNYEIVEPSSVLEINYSTEMRPRFPVFSYYSSFLSGKENELIKYFEFTIKPL
ncbi:hypothetical protein [Albibacterium bauzanense]|uniref:Glucosyltransferase GtrII-like protein n=1 Tax=Albibacterium bauzanense TaxID=653929 RepID=A0A4R1LZX7_9SPHI|nr:hypothetical protein [Albibacterium bauzanense]TCK84905.1 hypothetical protein C8N28_0200 [Albibacterium bauzanense]